MKNENKIKLGFWEKIKKNKRTFFCLAPMADVTDCAFREIIAKYGKPDVFWTEFVSADGLCSIGKKKLLINLKFSKKEHPLVAQIFGSNPENIKKASKLCAELGFDGIDINMGCPDKAVERQNSGSAMIKNPKKAIEIIRAAKAGAPKLPISVKTRIGYNKDESETWIRELLNENLAALTVHLRTRKEMSKVPAHWNLMPNIVKMRNEMKKETLIIGNGDVISVNDGEKKAKESGCDGIMIGRGIFGNPWLFSSLKKVSTKTKKEITTKEKLRVLMEHTRLFEKKLTGSKHFHVMKKHFKAYVNGFDGAKELRVKLMETENSKEVENIINTFIKNIQTF
jgi:nifR3 family TIM-barrel protein